MFTKYIKLSECVDNRDKCLKAAQNIQLFRSYLLQGQDDHASEQIFEMYQHIYICRRIFKLFKSLQMVLNIREHWAQTKNRNKLIQIPQSVNQMSTYTVNVLFFIFHLVENAMVLHQLGFYKNSFNHKVFKVVTHSFWSGGLITQLVYYLNRLRQNFRREGELKTQLINGMTPAEFMKQIRTLSEERWNYVLLIVRILGDTTCGLQKTQLPEKILNTRFNRGMVAIGGLTSALIQLYIQWNKKSEIKKQEIEI